MPVKFKPSHKSFVKGKGTKIEHFYIKNISKEELIEYINNSSGKPKIKQKYLHLSLLFNIIPKILTNFTNKF